MISYVDKFGGGWRAYRKDSPIDRMEVSEGDVISCIRQDIKHIGHFHTAGVPGRHEIDDSQELNYPAIMRAIAATNYDGYVGQEFNPVRGASNLPTEEVISLPIG